jgi:hypothetical protein
MRTGYDAAEDFNQHRERRFCRVLASLAGCKNILAAFRGSGDLVA